MSTEEALDMTTAAPTRVSWAVDVLEGTHVLVLGAGEGETAIAVARAGHEVSGADRSPADVRVAREAVLSEDEPVRARVRFLVVEGPLPYRRASFDSVLIEDLSAEADTVDALLEDLRRVVRPGGRVAAWMAHADAPGLIGRLAGAGRIESSGPVDDGVGVTLRLAGEGAPPEAAMSAAVDVRALLSALRDDQRRIGRLEAERDRLAAELARAEALEARVVDRAAFQAENAQLRHDLERSSAELERARRALADLARERDELQVADTAQVNRLARELDQERQRAEQARADADRRAVDQARLEREFEVGRHELEDFRRHTAEARQRLKDELRETKTRARRHEQDAADQRERRRRAERQLRSHEKELAALKGSRGYRFMRFSWRLTYRVRHPLGGPRRAE